MKKKKSPPSLQRGTTFLKLSLVINVPVSAVIAVVIMANYIKRTPKLCTLAVTVSAPCPIA